MKQNMKQIMSLAWVIARETGMGIGDALRMSWKNFKLKLAMKQSVVSFTYRKVGGEIRNATGTLSESVIPSHNNAMGTGRKPNESVQCYFDCGKEAWRSFRKSNLISIML